MVSLKTKNPFGSGLNILDWRVWVGVGATAILAGTFYVMARGVSNRVEKAGNPIEAMQERLAGLGA